MRQRRRQEQYEKPIRSLYLIEIGILQNDKKYPQDFRLADDNPCSEIIISPSPQAAQKLVEWSERLGKFLAGGQGEGEEGERRSKLTSSQIRKVYGEVRRLWMEAQRGWNDSLTRKLYILIPKLEYSARKEVAAKALRAVLVGALREVLKGETNEAIKRRFDRFVEFFEAILAYYYAAGGK